MRALSDLSTKPLKFFSSECLSYVCIEVPANQNDNGYSNSLIPNTDERYLTS